MTFGTDLPFGLNSREERLVLPRQWSATFRRIPAHQIRCDRLYQRFHQLPDGRLVPQRDQHPRRSQGFEIPRQWLCRHHPTEAGRGAAADRRRRYLSALEKGTIDAAEWVGPHDDEKLGFVKVAVLLLSGWWEPGATPHYLFNLAKWNELPKIYQAAILAAGQESGNG